MEMFMRVSGVMICSRGRGFMSMRIGGGMKESGREGRWMGRGSGNGMTAPNTKEAGRTALTRDSA